MIAFVLPASQDIIAFLTRRPRPWLFVLAGFTMLSFCSTSENGTLSDSAISSSDSPAAWEPLPGRLSRHAGNLASLLFAFLIAVDPYDSGKFGFLGIDGVDDRNTPTASASRARDPHFDSAIIGNSTALLLNPDPLSRGDGPALRAALRGRRQSALRKWRCLISSCGITRCRRAGVRDRSFLVRP